MYIYWCVGRCLGLWAYGRGGKGQGPSQTKPKKSKTFDDPKPRYAAALESRYIHRSNPHPADFDTLCHLQTLNRPVDRPIRGRFDPTRLGKARPMLLWPATTAHRWLGSSEASSNEFKRPRPAIIIPCLPAPPSSVAIHPSDTHRSTHMAA